MADKLLLFPRSFSGEIVSVLSGPGTVVSWDGKSFAPVDGVSVGEVLTSNPASERDLSAAGITSDMFEVAAPASDPTAAKPLPASSKLAAK